MSLPDGLIAYGPNANCTLADCPLSDSVYTYLPSLAASGVYIALFGIAAIAHTFRGIKWREWWFMGCVLAGCIDEMIGYGGRIIYHGNPFSFTGFLMQIICITTAPVFFCAAIYILLTRITSSLGPQYSHFRPRFYLAIFLPCDIISLVLQALGGALSSTSAGSDKNGVDISLAGLSFQVITLFCFMVVVLDYFLRYHRDTNQDKVPVPKGIRLWAASLALAVICIFIRCAYRIDELKDGYSGPVIAKQGLFIGLEGAMIAVAVFALLFAHPGPVFNRTENVTHETMNVSSFGEKHQTA